MKKSQVIVWCIFFCASVGMAQPIELIIQKGHSSDILFVTFNSTGRLLASSGADHLIKLWHVPTGKEMASFVSASMEEVKSMRFSEGDDFLYVQYAGGVVHTWDIVHSKLYSTQTPITAIPFRDQKNFLTSDGNYQVHAERFHLMKTDRQSGNTIFSKVPMDISKDFTSLAVSEKRKWLIGASGDYNVYVYDLEKGNSIATLDLHLNSVNSVCLSPDEEFFASASSDRSIILWSTRTWKPIRRLFSRSFRFECLSFDPSGNHLVVGDELGMGHLVDLQSSRLKVSTLSLHDKKISSIQFSPDDSMIYSAGYDNRVVSYNLNREAVVDKEVYHHYFDLGDLFLTSLGAYHESFSWLNALALSPDGSKLITGGAWRESQARHEAQRIRIEDRAQGKTVQLRSHQGAIDALEFIDNSQFVSGHANELYYWYAPPGSTNYFFRKTALDVKANIAGFHVLSSDTLLVNATSALLWMDLEHEKVIQQVSATNEITAIAYGKKEHRIAYSDGHGITIADLNGRTMLNIPDAHTDRITALAFNPGRSLLASSSWDATVKLWNAQTGQLIATLITIGKGDHMIITPDNYYFGTRNALKGIGFKSGKQFISPEQFDLRFNRPDIVLKRLGYANERVINSYRRAYEKRLQKMNFTEAMLGTEIQLPEILITTPDIPLSTTEASLHLDVRSTDAYYKLDRINVFVNNIPLFGTKGIDLRAEARQLITRSLNIPLSKGKNKIQVSCLNEKGVESLVETIEVDYMHPPSKPDLYLAVISVSRYDDARMNLKYAAKDGRDLVRLFSRKGDRYEHVIIDSLMDERATRENIQGLRKKFQQSRVDDEIMVFVSGHGMLDDRMDFYFGTHDVNFSDPAARGLKYEDLETLLDGVPARHKLLMIDACHSGEVDKTRLMVASGESVVLARNARGLIKTYTYQNEAQDEQYQVGIKTSFELMQELFTNVSKGSGAVVISAAAGNSYAFESDEWRNGVFTYCLLQGLRNRLSDANHDGIVTVNELKEYVSREVERLTQGAQKPTSRSENLEFDFRVW